MSKGITMQVLLESGFVDDRGIYSVKANDCFISIINCPFMEHRNWECKVSAIGKGKADVFLESIGQFNNLMDAMNLDFRLKEE